MTASKKTNRNKRNLAYPIAGLAALLTFIVYSSTLHNGFVYWDDDEYVLENLHIRSLDFAFFKWAFFNFYSANWHPLTWISHALDYAIWGLNPMGHHLTNNVFHAINTFLVVLLVVKLIKAVHDSPFTIRDSRLTSHYSRFALIAAATTGLLFGLHPIHVESVAWIAERKDLLCALFYLLSVMAYVKYRTYKSYTTYFLSLGFFFLALLSKPMAVSLPVVLLILDWYPFQKITSLKTFRTAFVEKLPFIALSSFSSIVTILAQGSAAVIRSAEFAPLSTRSFSAVKALAAYLYKIILPLNLLPFYPYALHPSSLFFEYLLPIVLAIGITAGCISLAGRREKFWLCGWTYYVATLLPVLGIVQVGDQAMADRYMYLPSLGPFLVIGLTAAWGWERWLCQKIGVLSVSLFMRGQPCLYLF